MNQLCSICSITSNKNRKSLSNLNFHGCENHHVSICLIKNFKNCVCSSVVRREMKNKKNFGHLCKHWTWPTRTNGIYLVCFINVQLSYENGLLKWIQPWVMVELSPLNPNMWHISRNGNTFLISTPYSSMHKVSSCQNSMKKTKKICVTVCGVKAYVIAYTPSPSLSNFMKYHNHTIYVDVLTLTNFGKSGVVWMRVHAYF